MMIEMKTGTYIKGDENFNFNFTTELTSVDKLKFVNSVVSLVVDDEHYNSVIRDLIFDFYIIDIFTDIDTLELKESKYFIKDVEELLKETNIVDIIKAGMKDGLLDELNHAVDLNIEYRTGIHPNLLNEAISNLVNTIEKKVKEFDLESMMSMATKLADMKDEFTMENLVKAYTSTDLFKNNLAEIEEVKKAKK